MELEIEQIVAGALLYFENISSLDISLLVEDFKKTYPDFELKDLSLNHLGKYVELNHNKLSLKKGLILNSDFKKNIKQIAGKNVMTYFQTFDFEKFILKKVEKLSRVRMDELDTIFCDLQLKELQKLDGKGYLTITLSNDIINDDDREIKLSNYGKVALFKKMYDNELKVLIAELNSRGCDLNFVDQFLLTQNLKLPVQEILTVNNIDAYLNNCDIEKLKNKSSELNFIRLENKKSEIFNEEGKKCIENILSVWDDSHCIFICHPNHLFTESKFRQNARKVPNNINWNNIDINKMFQINNYKMFISPNCHDAFKYVHNRLRYEIMKKENINFATYLVVVEQYIFDYEDNYIVRGIIKGDWDGYSIAFNPEYQKTVPQSIFEKSIRFSGNEIPNIYCQKRKK